MSTKQSKYYDKTIDGYLCTFYSKDHKCAAVLLTNGMDIKAWEEFNSKMVGSIDPDYKNDI